MQRPRLRIGVRSVLAVVALLAGCGAPRAVVDGRSLTGQLVPPGRMAMLPPILSPIVQYPAPAAAFADDLLRDLQRAELSIEHDDVAGRLGPRTASMQIARQMITSPGTTATQSAPATRPAPNYLPLAQRYQYWQEKGFATVAQPVITRYGYYTRYTPTQISDNQAYWYHGPDMGWYGGWGEGPNPGWEAEWGRDWAQNSEPSWWSTQYGTFLRQYSGYSPTIRPGQLHSVAAVAIEYQIFDVPRRQHVYYILATSSSPRLEPDQLEAGFPQPLVRAFRQAYLRPGFRMESSQTQPAGL